MNLKVIFIHPAIFLVVLFLTVSYNAAGQITEDVRKAFETGNAELLGRHFTETVTLNISGEEGEIGKEEAKLKLRAFFSRNTIRQFTVKFEGNKTRSNFMIASLETDTDTYRINVFFKKTDTHSFIHLLRIEKENESSF